MRGERSGSKRKGGGGGLMRSETVTVRLDPRLRYLAELAARRHRRTVSSFVEWAVEKALFEVMVRDKGPSVGEIADRLWDVDEADRLAGLAFQFPELLTHDEQVLWKLVQENGLLWRGDYDPRNGNEWTWRIEPRFLHFDRLRAHWDIFKAVVEGTATADKLPTWQRTQPTDTDDAIPF